MPRIRTIKPEFWTNPQVCRCEHAARLLFIGTWNFADDHGNLPRDTEKLKMQVFPGKLDIDMDVEPLLVSLIAHGLLIEYSGEDGQRFLHIPTFRKHQIVNRPSKPACPLPDKKLIEESVRGFNALQDKADREMNARSKKNGMARNSMNAHARLTEHSLQEGKGREVNLKPKTLNPSVDLAIDGSKPDDEVSKIFGYWQERMKSPRSKLDDKRKRIIRKALESYSPADVCKAIRGCSRDAWSMGENERGRPFNSIELILRDAEHVERYIGFDANLPNPVGNGASLTTQQIRQRTLEEFGLAAQRPRDPNVLDLPPEDCHVAIAKS
jgi:hypothetical protein